MQKNRSAIAVLLADDHAVVRDGLRALLEAQDDIQVVGDATNGRDAVRQVTELLPDVVVGTHHTCRWHSSALLPRSKSGDGIGSRR